MEDKAVAHFVLILMYKVKLGLVYGRQSSGSFCVNIDV
jgi:hypothetical protein